MNTSVTSRKVPVFQRPDIVFLSFYFLLCLAVCFFVYFFPSLLGENDGEFADVYSDGTLIASLPLNTDTFFEIAELDFIIAVENGAVRVVSSPCRDGICMLSGARSTHNSSIVCVPSKIVIKIRGEHDEYDVIAG